MKDSACVILCVCMLVCAVVCMFASSSTLCMDCLCILLGMQRWAFAHTSGLENGSPEAPRALRALPKSQVLILLSVLCLYTQRELVLVSVGRP